MKAAAQITPAQHADQAATHMADVLARIQADPALLFATVETVLEQSGDDALRGLDAARTQHHELSNRVFFSVFDGDGDSDREASDEAHARATDATVTLIRNAWMRRHTA